MTGAAVGEAEAEALFSAAFGQAEGILLAVSGGPDSMALLGLGSLGPVVPTGGLLYIAGWLSLLVYALTR